jgi:histone chaperone ASF1
MMPLEDDLEWKVLYVGSAEDTTHDQVLDEILVGPVPVGVSKFVLQADAPDISQIPEGDILGVTVVLVTCSYREKEFVRVGFYVNNEPTSRGLRDSPSSGETRTKPPRCRCRRRRRATRRDGARYRRRMTTRA